MPVRWSRTFSPPRELELPRALKKLDHFDLLILDDIGYIKQRPDEVEVLSLMAERYDGAPG
ncbi:MAG: hypothetical protein R3F61_25270 [Myxococcota bacterium]